MFTRGAPQSTSLMTELLKLVLDDNHKCGGRVIGVSCMPLVRRFRCLQDQLKKGYKASSILERERHEEVNL
jgi:hypothetical protein